jgi:hypothetical protein
MFIGLYPVVVSCEENSFALAVVFRFYNESLSFSIVKLIFKLFYVGGQHPSLRKESELCWEVFLHGEQVFG